MPEAPSQEEVLSYFDTLSNWGRWGDDDTLGTLNLITDAKRRQAASLVHEGVSISCSRLIPWGGPQLAGGNPVIDMAQSGERYALGDNPEDPAMPGVEPLQWAGERLSFAFHGSIFTHIDGLAHVFFDGKMYNGRSAGLVKASEGALEQTSEVMRDGIMTRGVLLDVARALGQDPLPMAPGVYPEDLEAAEAAQGVRVEEGDVVLLRTGYGAQHEAAILARQEPPHEHSGYHAATLPWLHERGAAVIGSDVTTDTRYLDPNYKRTRMPVHQIALVAMGLRLIDNAHLERLAVACEERGRWEFCFTLNPLRFERGTGSPANPIATF